MIDYKTSDLMECLNDFVADEPDGPGGQTPPGDWWLIKRARDELVLMGDAIKAETDKARDDALEEAARTVDRYRSSLQDTNEVLRLVAANIRALKDGPR